MAGEPVLDHAQDPPGIFGRGLEIALDAGRAGTGRRTTVLERNPLAGLRNSRKLGLVEDICNLVNHR